MRRVERGRRKLRQWGMARISRQILGFEEEADTRLAKALESDVQVCLDSGARGSDQDGRAPVWGPPRAIGHVRMLRNNNYSMAR